MNTRRNNAGWQPLISAIAGFLLIIIAGLIWRAWAKHDLTPLQLHPDYGPVHFNTAIGLMIWGAALLALWRNCPFVARVAGAVLLLFGAIALGHSHSLFNFGFDSWAYQTATAHPAFARSGMQAPTSLGFCLAGFILLLITRPQLFFGQWIVVSVAGGILLAGGLAIVVGFQIGPQFAGALGPALVGVAGTMIGGFALLSHAFRPSEGPLPVGYQAPLLVGLAGVVFTLVLWQGVNAQQNRRLSRQVQSEAASVKRLLDEKLQARVDGLVDLAERWPQTPADRRKRGVEEYTLRKPGCLGVARIDGRKKIEWIEAPDRKILPMTLANFGVDEALRPFVSQGRAVALQAPPSFWNGSQVIVVYAPFQPTLPAEGGLLGVLRIKDLIGAIFDENLAPGYALSVTEAGQPVYGRSDAESRYRIPWEQTLDVEFEGYGWKLHVWPTEEVLSRESPWLPRLALGFGLLTATLLALAVHLAQISLGRERELENEIYDRVQVQNALQKSEEKYRSLIENLQQGIFLKDKEGRYIAANLMFCRSLGRSKPEVIGRTDADLFDAELAQAQASEDQYILAGGEKIENEHERELDGKKMVFRRVLTPVKNELGRNVGVLGICWDVTDQRTIEARLRQASKMDAIGQLAGGIAHDFNNLLTAILGNLDLMLGSLPDGDRCREPAQAAHGAAKRAASLTNRLLGFSRQHHIDWEPSDLNAIVADVVTLIGRTIDPRVRLETHLCQDIWLVHADPDQINQVLMNLCLNARDAVRGVGKITIETSCVELVDWGAFPHADARAGSFVRLRVLDTGCGMSREVRAQYFEPFFTTKEVGKGTGLGLAMVFAIVRQHRGWIECQSEPNCGTQFDIYLPRTTATSNTTPAPASTPCPIPSRPSFETILLADDEPMIRRLASTVLQKHGYTVLQVEDGQQAVDLYDREHHRIDLVLLDLTMPNLSGQEAFRQMLRINPRVKVMFASGYAAEQISEKERKLILGFVKKPYRPEELVQTIQEALLNSQPKVPKLCAS